jgi:hypothetical protein
VNENNLLENFTKAQLWWRSKAAMTSEDIVLASFPKTGSSWLRIIMYHYLFGEQTGKFSFDDLDASMPEFGKDSMINTRAASHGPRFVKTHQPYPFLFSGMKSIVIARDPKDTMLSYYHYLIARRLVKNTITFGEVVKGKQYGLRRYYQFYSRWQKKTDLFVKYEDMKRHPLETIKLALEGAGLDVDVRRLEKAIENSTMERTRTAQDRSSNVFKNQFEKGYQFARSGTTGEGVELFDDTLIELNNLLSTKYHFDMYDK